MKRITAFLLIALQLSVGLRAAPPLLEGADLMARPTGPGLIHYYKDKFNPPQGDLEHRRQGARLLKRFIPKCTLTEEDFSPENQNREDNILAAMQAVFDLVEHRLGDDYELGPLNDGYEAQRRHKINSALVNLSNMLLHKHFYPGAPEAHPLLGESFAIYAKNIRHKVWQQIEDINALDYPNGADQKILPMLLHAYVYNVIEMKRYGLDPGDEEKKRAWRLTHVIQGTYSQSKMLFLIQATLLHWGYRPEGMTPEGAQEQKRAFYEQYARVDHRENAPLALYDFLAHPEPLDEDMPQPAAPEADAEDEIVNPLDALAPNLTQVTKGKKRESDHRGYLALAQQIAITVEEPLENPVDAGGGEYGSEPSDAGDEAGGLASGVSSPDYSGADASDAGEAERDSDADMSSADERDEETDDDMSVASDEVSGSSAAAAAAQAPLDDSSRAGKRRASAYAFGDTTDNEEASGTSSMPAAKKASIAQPYLFTPTFKQENKTAFLKALKRVYQANNHQRLLPYAAAKNLAIYFRTNKESFKLQHEVNLNDFSDDALRIKMKRWVDEIAEKDKQRYILKTDEKKELNEKQKADILAEINRVYRSTGEYIPFNQAIENLNQQPGAVKMDTRKFSGFFRKCPNYIRGRKQEEEKRVAFYGLLQGLCDQYKKENGRNITPNQLKKRAKTDQKFQRLVKRNPHLMKKKTFECAIDRDRGRKGKS